MARPGASRRLSCLALATVAAFAAGTGAAQAADLNLARGKVATASSQHNAANGPTYAVDGVGTTRWASTIGVTTGNWKVDLGSNRQVDKVVVAWDAAFAKKYSIWTSPEVPPGQMTTVTTVAEVDNLTEPGTRTHTFPTHVARYVTISMETRGTVWGYAFFEAEVYGAPDTTITGGPSGSDASTAPFTFTTPEPGSTFQCRVDAGAWAGCTSPFPVPSVAAGHHKLEVRAVDSGGNADPSPALRTWTKFGAGAGKSQFFRAAGPDFDDLTNSGNCVSAFSRYYRMRFYPPTPSNGCVQSGYGGGLGYQDIQAIYPDPQSGEPTGGASASWILKDAQGRRLYVPYECSGNLALNKTATASSTQAGFPPANAVDGDSTGTRWSSVAADPQWWKVDLGSAQTIDTVSVNWEAAYARDYRVETSLDGTNWTTRATVTGGKGPSERVHTFAPVNARHVRIYMTVRATQFGYSFWDVKVSNAGGKCTQYAADIGNPAFREWYIDTIRAWMPVGYRGVFVDDVNWNLNVGNLHGFVTPIDPRTGEAMTTSAWRTYMADFLEEIKDEFQGKEMMINSVWWKPDSNLSDATVARGVRAATHWEIERGTSDTNTPQSFYDLLAYIDRLHGLGVDVNLEDYNDNTREGAEFEMGTYFLISTGADSYSVRYRSCPEAIGDCAAWWPAYATDLGTPTGAYTTDGALRRRAFTNGLVLVNPPGAASRTVSVGAGYTNLDGQSVSSVTLAGGRAAVLKK